MQISVSKQIHADLAHQHGFLGEGIGIAYLDTGLFPHKDFSPHSTRIAKFVDFVHSKSFSYRYNSIWSAASELKNQRTKENVGLMDLFLI